MKLFKKLPELLDYFAVLKFHFLERTRYRKTIKQIRLLKPPHEKRSK